MTRIDRLSENQLVAAIESLEADLNALKSGAPQFIGGASLAVHISQTDDTYDFNGTLTATDPDVTGGKRSNFIVTATADHSNVLYGQIIAQMWVGSNSSPYLPDDHYADLAAGDIPFTMTVVDIPPDPVTESNQKRWSVQVRGDDSRNCWLKFYVYGLDTAAVEVSRNL